MKFLLASAIVAGALAACPNQCSGHGYCDENDRCICYKAPGTKGGLRDAYTGADCSQKVCPFGVSHDYISDSTQELMRVNFDSSLSDVALYRKGNAATGHKLRAFLNNGFLLKKDIGVDVKVVSVDTSLKTGKFAWKLNTERTFNKEETFVVGANPATNAERKSAYHVQPLDASNMPTPSGLFLFFQLDTADVSDGATQKIFANDYYYLNVTNNEGVKFASDDLNTAHSMTECSNRGLCDRAAGVCKCVDGYEGDACQRTSCPNDCSGHGTCQSQYYFVEDATTVASYNAFDAKGQMGCKCDSGFRGADCSQIECPSGADPLKGEGGLQGRDCSGRGQCDYSTGLCQCFKGFFGERCEEVSNLV